MTSPDWLQFALVTLLFCTLVAWQAVRGPRSSKVEDLPAIEIEWRPDLCVFDSPSHFGYHVYTEQHDQTVEAANFPSRPGAEERRQMLDKIIHARAEATIRLTHLLRERGVGSGVSASLLVDHSGSMNREAGTGPKHRPERGPVVATDSGAALAASVAISTAQALGDCGAITEVLGFTTSEWRGGKSRRNWLNAGEPQRPGRLNDLLHIIYKRADEPPASAWIDRMEALLYPLYLKENIDGEAIAWARSRLLARSSPNRLLIVISDGAPVDDSTLQENGPSYLEHHLLHVIEDINRRRDIRIIGFGIGYAISRYLSQSVVIGPEQDSFEQKIHTIADLIAKPV